MSSFVVSSEDGVVSGIDADVARFIILAGMIEIGVAEDRAGIILEIFARDYHALELKITGGADVPR